MQWAPMQGAHHSPSSPLGSGTAALAGRLEEQDAGRDPNIQALDGWPQGDGEAKVRTLFDARGKARALVAQQESDGAAEIGLLVAQAPARHSGRDTEPARREPAQGPLDRALAQVGEPERAAHGAAEGFPGQRIRGGTREHGAGCSRPLGGAEERTQVPRVLYAYGDYHQRRPAKDLVFGEPGPFRDAEQPLARFRFGQRVEHRVMHSADHDPVLRQRPKSLLPGCGALGAARGRRLEHAHSCAHRLQDQPRPLEQARLARPRGVPQLPQPADEGVAAAADRLDVLGHLGGACYYTSSPKRPARKPGRADWFSGCSIEKVMLEIKKRLEDEIRKLDYELKVVLPKEILKAREHGDLRENAEYKAAKERQSYLQARIGQLHRRAAALSMLNLDKIPHGKIGLGSTVSLRHLETDEEVVYEIVTPEESDPASGRISPSSPIGKSLLNHEEGDTLQVKVPAGTKEYEVIKVVTIHDQVKD
jgi:transcription elongation factor GreA